ncbi:C4b-binding protein alpha chain isoform X1 [Erinaceus europaeus]|uniref:C4b-binding protein alpha chain isoform X1 n=1 Tax=Erinaceus europaeus TaxID=9365 RepID=A0A1S3WM49_ERIEU|nr:C4b-binding protein alpha chain isoform X1 [Erinaceus europaeus]
MPWKLRAPHPPSAWPGRGLLQLALVAALLPTVLGSCDTPPSVFFALPVSELNQSSFETGTVLKYKCRPGYSKSSSSTQLTCKPSGQWSYSTFCVKKKCRNPGELANGQVIVKSDLSFGSQIEFSCSDGFLLSGPTSTYCDIQNNIVDWTDPFPECIIAKCEAPPEIPHGKHSGEEDDVYTYGSSVTYSCHLGYSLLGQASISCSVKNKTLSVWHPSPPECRKIRCPTPKVEGGIVVTGFGPVYTYKDSIAFLCNRGFDLRGSNIIHCEADNNWNPPPPVCEPNSCIGVPEVANGFWVRNHYYADDSVFEVGTVLTLTCNQGFRAKAGGETKVRCQRDLTWSAHTTCEEVCCPEPELENGRITGSRRSGSLCHYRAGDSISYTCYEMYSFEAHCTQNGRWNPDMPTCEAHSCNFPPAIAHGRHKRSRHFFVTRVIYECDQGYSLVGPEELTCGNSGWPKTLPQCKAQCLKPVIPHGAMSPEKAQYQEPEVVDVRCDAGYQLVGPQTISCSENRTWSPQLPRCEWEMPVGCEQVLAGQRLLQCLPDREEVRLALEVYKLSLEIRRLEEAPPPGELPVLAAH